MNKPIHWGNIEPEAFIGALKNVEARLKGQIDKVKHAFVFHGLKMIIRKEEGIPRLRCSVEGVLIHPTEDIISLAQELEALFCGKEKRYHLSLAHRDEGEYGTDFEMTVSSDQGGRYGSVVCRFDKQQSHAMIMHIDIKKDLPQEDMIEIIQDALESAAAIIHSPVNHIKIVTPRENKPLHKAASSSKVSEKAARIISVGFLNLHKMNIEHIFSHLKEVVKVEEPLEVRWIDKSGAEATVNIKGDIRDKEEIKRYIETHFGEVERILSVKKHIPSVFDPSTEPKKAVSMKLASSLSI